MKYRIQDTKKFLKGISRNLKFIQLWQIIACGFLFLSSLVPIQAQQSNQEIERLKTKINEAFIKDVVVLSSSVVESEDGLPKHILVKGYTMPSNYFLIRMPIDDWNQKLYLGGCGAGCGTLPTGIWGNLKTALQRGYTTATMNTGHWSESIFDISWAYNNPQAEKEYAYRAVHETVRATREIMAIFYNRPPEHAYFRGCSGGGRQAIMEAARYPDDFDGIISEAPVINMTDLFMLYIWISQTNTGSDGKEILSKQDIEIIHRSVNVTCDAIDGLEDGLIHQPEKCQFDPEALFCEDESKCLNREKVDVLKKWYDGPVNSRGEKLLSTGMAPGSELFWSLWILGETNEQFDGIFNIYSMVKNLAFEVDPTSSFSLLDFDFDTDLKKLKYMGDLLNVDERTLKPYKERGGKLLIYHGTADPMIPCQYSIDYYHHQFEEYGEELKNFCRLFLIPGYDHCGSQSTMGVTGKSLDPLTALENWVEKDTPPQELPVTQFKNDGSVKSKFSVPFYVKNE